MDYKEKLEEAKKLYASANVDQKRVLESLFPELKESENVLVEKIRQDIISYLNHRPIASMTESNATERWLSWLEKQGEKSQDKSVLEVWKDMRLEVYQQASGNRHEPNYTDDSTKMFSLTDIDEIFEKIAEKQGERKVNYTTLVETGNGGINTLVTRELSTNGYSEQKSANEVEPKFKVGDWITNGDYTWKIVEIKPLDYILQSQDGNIVDDTISHVDEQFHSFTLEDAKDGDILATEPIDSYPFPFVAIYKNRGLDFFNSYCFIGLDGKFYKGENGHSIENIHPATKEQCDTLMKAMTDAGYEWDEEKKELKKIEDEEYNGEDYGIDCLFHAQRILEKTLGRVEGYQTDDGILSHKCAITAVKKLYRQKPTWSEEDEHKVKDIIYFLDTAKKHYASTVELDACIDWLKSLKQKIIWKPSEKQINALDSTLQYGQVSHNSYQYLNLLYNDLTKLRKMPPRMPYI